MYENAGANAVLQEQADQVYREALAGFRKCFLESRANKNDSLGFYASLQAALISFYLDEQDSARYYYLQSFVLKKTTPYIPDSILFVPYIYTGGIYYNQHSYDSAMYFYNQAEAIQEKYLKPLPEAERLYNRLGVMFYETGDYSQARNYFEKALILVGETDPNLKANYQMNIASIHIKLEEFTQARQIYESLLLQSLYKDEINHNLAIISLNQGQPLAALGYLRKVEYEGNKKIQDLYYNYAMAFANLHIRDSSELYYQKAVTENIKWNGQRKNVSYGLLLRFRADALAARGRLDEALQFYQKAISQFHPHFIDETITNNPDTFTGVFSYINLFNTLTSKATAMEKKYKVEKEQHFLEASLNTYSSAFRLSEYVEKTYDSDESRFFLNKIKHIAHSKPINVSIELYRLTNQKKYLESAYQFDQWNKASVLSLNVKENEDRKRNVEKDSLFLHQSTLKRSITRLSLRASSVTDSMTLQQIHASIRDAEIELGRVNDKINKDPFTQKRLANEIIPRVKDLQKMVDNKTAIISFHLSDRDLLALIITGNQFNYTLTPVQPDFIPRLDSFRSQLHETKNGIRYNGYEISFSLYKMILAPVISKLDNVERLIIIPDDELNYLPFEALQDASKVYLIEKYSLQYNFSTSLLVTNSTNTSKDGILAMAPFSSKSFNEKGKQTFTALPASRQEIVNLAGTILLDSLATKKNFMNLAGNYGIVHLATHASADNENPQRSFINFYPGNEDYILYAGEIYDMQLDSTDLVILSACETGAGKLVKGEGLMSLSRAFAYAGCQNIITSLWKAEDISTSYILQQLHGYLANGYSKDQALQNAKKDLLTNEDIDPMYKSPNYWAHLVFIGEYEARPRKSPWAWLAGGLLLGSILYLVFKRSKKRHH